MAGELQQCGGLSARREVLGPVQLRVKASCRRAPAEIAIHAATPRRRC